MIFICPVGGLQAQVTIGNLTSPAAGAVLDLNSPGGNNITAGVYVWDGNLWTPIS